MVHSGVSGECPIMNLMPKSTENIADRRCGGNGTALCCSDPSVTCLPDLAVLTFQVVYRACIIVRDFILGPAVTIGSSLPSTNVPVPLSIIGAALPF